MDIMIALLLIPYALSRQKTIGIFWLEVSTADKFVTV